MIDNSLEKIIRQRLVPVFYHDDTDVCLKVVQSCYNSGIEIFEFTNRGAHAQENFEAIRQYVNNHCPRMLLGAGTILDTTTAKRFMQLGADFIVSPALVLQMSIIKNDVLWIPGCATVSELVTARDIGAQLIKVFPGELLRPQFVKAALSVLPNLKLMPTGGIQPTEENLKSWFASGVCAVGMGAKLLDTDLIKNQQWEQLEKHIKDVKQIINKL